MRNTYTITIPIRTDIDPSTLLDLALEFAAYVQGQTGQDCAIDDDNTSVEEI